MPLAPLGERFCSCGHGRRRPVLMGLAWFLMAAMSAGRSQAEAVSVAPDHPIVPGFERIYSAADADATSGGQVLLGELNCASCHPPAAAWKDQINTKVAPILDRVGARVRVEYLRKFLANPQLVKPGTTMPNLFAGVAGRRGGGPGRITRPFSGHDRHAA